YVAEHIDGARYIELAGEDYLFFVGDTEPLLDAIEEFVTGRLPHHEVDRVLATVLFTDVVRSTPRSQAWATGDGPNCWLHTTASSAPNSRASAAVRYAPPATDSWQPSTGQAGRCAARVPSATPCARSASRCASGSTLARSNCTATTSAASPFTSPNASNQSPSPTKCSSRAPSPISSAARALSSRIAAFMRSRACRIRGDSSPSKTCRDPALGAKSPTKPRPL